MIEHVLVAPRDALHPEPWPQGFAPLDAAAADRWLTAVRQHGFFAPRPQAEDQPAWKQPIPYCLLRRGEEIYIAERLQGGGDARLHGRLSAGMGGHVGPGDGAADAEDLLAKALARELAEELRLPSPLPPPRLVGLINDDSNPVGRVHVGFAFVLDIPTSSSTEGSWADLEVRETSVLRGRWARLAGSDSLWQHLQQFESWSQILLEGLFRP